MIVRIGIPPSPQYGGRLLKLGAAALISANALRRRNGTFRHPVAGKDFGGLTDIALDSAGYVAMVRYKCYPWSVESYLDLAQSFPWAWWASMDFCCEPQIAANRREVMERITMTAMKYSQLGALACERQGLKPPIPVLQGWEPDDYLRCVDMMGGADELPDLCGVGSVCRRGVGRRDGILSIVGRLDGALPARVKLHLFGVKGDAIPMLLGHPRIASVDSMAWNYAARRELPMPRTVAKCAGYMVDWWRRQTQHQNLFGRAT